MDNYKGIYYNATNEQKSFEGGAHFRYNDLYRALSALVSLLPPERTNTCDDNKENTQHNKEQDEVVHHVIKVEEVQTEIKGDDKVEVKSRNKQNGNNLFQGISVTAVNAGPGLNTQIVLSGNNTTINVLNSNNTTSDPVVANGNLHCRQKSENNNNVNVNNLNLNGYSSKLTTFSNGNSNSNNNNNNKCKSNSKNENAKTKIRIHSASLSNNNNNCSSNNNEHNKLKPKKIDPIRHKCVSKHKKVNVKPVTSQHKKHSNNNNTNTMLLMLNKYRNSNNNHHHQHTRHLSENKNDMSGHHSNNCLNKSVNNPKSRNVNNNNNNNSNHIGISSLNNKIKKISHLTINDINSTNNNNKNSRNKKHNLQCNSLYGLLTFNKTTSNIISTKKSKVVKYKNGVCNGGIGGNYNAVNFADLFIKKKDVGTNKKH